MFEGEASPFVSGYYAGKRAENPINPHLKGTDNHIWWWFGYQKGWFEKYWSKKRNRRWLKEYLKSPSSNG